MLPDDLRPVFKAAIHRSPSPLPIGFDARIRVNLFLDLLSACHEPDTLSLLARHFSDWISSHFHPDKGTGLAAPKRGNVLLAREVAASLKMSSCFVKDDILFGSYLEGTVEAGGKVILLDDVASDGEMLRDVAKALRREGVYVDRVLVLVDRSEGDATAQLREEGLNYDFFVQMSDEDLANL